MTTETGPFDPADYLDSPEAMLAYFDGAFADGDAGENADALRAHGMSQLAEKPGLTGLAGIPQFPLPWRARRPARPVKGSGRAPDPVTEKRAAQSKLKAANASALPFQAAAERYLEAHESTWRNAKHGAQWKSTLETYAFPRIGSMLVHDVEVPHALSVLEPIWREKTETASRVRGRIESVIDWATARGFREGLNPARWRGHLDNLLPSPAKIARPTHHPALPLDQIGVFLKRLRQEQGFAARALEFLILTAARSGEVRGASWDEIDLREAVWTIPADRMKAGREHRVPLAPAALNLLEGLPRFEDQTLVFPSSRGGQLSDMAMTAVMRRMGVDAVPHGFRSTFRDWATERTGYPNQVAEMALAHAIGDKVEAAYRRGELLEKRRRMMADWAAFCAKTEFQGAKIAALRSKVKAA